MAVGIVTPLVVMAGLYYFVLNDAIKTAIDAAQQAATSNGFKIDGDSVVITPKDSGNSFLYVTGTVQNIADRDYEQVEIKIEMYDNQGVLIGQTLDYTNRLAMNETWVFKAACPSTNAASAKVVNVIAR